MTWKSAPIASFCAVGTGGTPLREQASRFYGGTIPWVKSGELREKVIFDTEEHITEAGLAESAAKMVPAGALLVALYGATVGRIAELGVPAATNQAVCHIVPDEKMADRRYLFYALRTKVPEWLSRRVGGAQPNISNGIIKETMIPLPPLAQQKRIAAVLDKADDLRGKRRQALATLDTLLQSVFLDMFGDPVTNPNKWPMVRIGDVVDELAGGKSVESEPDAITKNRVLKVSAVTWDEFQPDESKPIPDEYVPPAEHFPRAGDLLISRANTSALVGAAVYVWETPNNVVLPDKLWRFVWAKPRQVDPLFVLSVLRHPRFRYEMGKLASGTSGSMKNISKEKLTGMMIPLPPLAKQEPFAAAVRSHRVSRQQLVESTNRLDTLFAALQSAAFAGTLFNGERATGVPPGTLGEANDWLTRQGGSVDDHARASTKRLIGRDSL